MTIQTTTLTNGFRIVTEHMPGLQSASIGIWVAAGGRHETTKQNGIAHFLEHMAFKGTERRTALQIAEAIEDVGGYINAYTAAETTSYYARVLVADTGLALDVLADILRNPVFAQEEIDVERHVILQEIGRALDTPEDVIFDWLQEVAYPDQPIGRTILGLADNVKRFGRDDLETFVGQHYGPERLILAAAGGVDHDAIVKQAETLFGDMCPSEETAPEEARFRGGEIRQEKDLEQAHVVLGLEGPSYRDEAFYAMQIFSMALGGGMSSRLFQQIREQRGLCYSIFSQPSAYADTGMLSIYAGTGGEDVSDLITLTIDELKRAADMTPEEVARARAQMKAGLLMGLESPSSRAERLARMTQIWGKVPPLEETVARIDSVTTGDVRDMAEHFAARAPAALALYGPVAKAPSFEALQARRVA